MLIHLTSSVTKRDDCREILPNSVDPDNGDDDICINKPGKLNLLLMMVMISVHKLDTK